MGAGGTYAQGATGGNASATTSTQAAHTHTGGTIGSTTLTRTQVPSHTHVVGGAIVVDRGDPSYQLDYLYPGTAGNYTRAATGGRSSHTHSHAAPGRAVGHSPTVASLPPSSAMCSILTL